MKRVLTAVANGIDSVSKSGASLAGILMIVVALLVTLDVFVRGVFGFSFAWVYPIAVWSLPIFIFLCIPAGVRAGTHIRVDILIRRLAPRTQSLITFVGEFFGLLLIVILTYFFWDNMVGTAYRLEETSSHWAGFPMWPLYAIVAVFLTFLIIAMVLRMVRDMREYLTGGLEEREGLIHQSHFIIPLILVLVVLGALLYTVQPMIGLLILLMILLFSGVPVGFGLGLMGLIGLYFYGGFDAMAPIAAILYGKLESYEFLCLPMFMLGGGILARGKLGDQLFGFASNWLNWLPGGVGVAAVVTCALLAAMIGSSVAVAAAVGMFAIPALLSRGYDKPLTYSTIASGGALGLLIPPSAIFVFYGWMCHQSIGAMFMAGLIPGLVLMAFMAIYVIFSCKRSGHYERITGITWGMRLRSLLVALPALGGPVIVIGGIYSGIFTPTEAACVLVVYCLMVSFIQKGIPLRPRAVSDVAGSASGLAGMIMFIVVGALVMAHVVALEQIPQTLANWIVEAGMANWMVIVMMGVLYIIMGMFMEGAAMCLLTMPIFFPITVTLGMDPWWFGVFMCAFVGVSLITPPVGLNCFVIAGVARDSVGAVFRGIWPFVLLEFIFIILFTVWQPLVTWLPRLAGFIP
ncbi:MAG: TRAP transporter large permease subunit [Dehalococcoidia bacterium]|nr:TRAP transporter large permease subunit [Dehalococcoidia bacterium]